MKRTPNGAMASSSVSLFIYGLGYDLICWSLPLVLLVTLLFLSSLPPVARSLGRLVA